jgi:DNA polymerase III delta prime subunit
MQHSFIVKYQPLQIANFEQLPQGLKQIITSLISIDNLNILINGPSGVGKTAIINAIVRQYYGNASAKTCEDNVLILNSLKEQGIQYYRNDLRIFSQTSSTINGRRKIIILDDIDTINDQSQQVFRNYIDKYRRNVHFIMACTNIQKVINSLQSRTIIIEIPSPTTTTLFQIANRIISNEPSIQKNIIRTCNNEVCPLFLKTHECNTQFNLNLECPLEYIISLSNNTIRTLINYIEKLYIFNEPFTIDVAKNMYTNISFAELEKYTLHICKGELSDAIRVVYSLYDHGYSVIDIIETYFMFLKTTQQITEKQKYKLVSLLCKYITVFHNIHEDEIELALFTNNAIREMLSNE